MEILEDINIKTDCYHCGETVEEAGYKIDNKSFCCKGCQTVYQIINQHNLCTYYDLESKPGLNQKKTIRKGKFDLLSDETITNKLVHFKEDTTYHVTFYLPQVHCSSCVWILEHLSKLNSGILNSTVNFIKKEVTIQYNNEKTDLKEIAYTLADIGYEPHISLNDANKKSLKRIHNKQVLKIGIAGFCFGNIMMLSFPEYFSLGNYENEHFKNWFNYLNLFLSLPVLIYSASDFFISGLKSFKQKFLNIDAPIALAIAITFGRSVYEIVSNTGSGYLDSMSGIVFFMLLGRYFQNRTYQSISFDRDFTSYFPLGVTIISEDKTEKQVSVNEIKVGDRIKIFNDEIIPCDAILFYGKATIDYSFVTGEAVPIKKTIGEILYAGGKQTSGVIELEVVKEVSQSYLTQLWNNSTFNKNDENIEDESFIHKVSKYFTIALFSIAIITAIYWQFTNPSRTWNAVTSILIVACPCALLLSATFTNGNMIQQLNKFKFYIKNNSVLERLAKINCIVFDKTGTITQQQINKTEFFGDNLTYEQIQLIISLAGQSNHPLSKAIINSSANYKKLAVHNFKETKGAGIEGEINGKKVKLGSLNFILNSGREFTPNGSRVYVSIDSFCIGYFEIKTKYRKHLKTLLNSLSNRFKLALLSGDNDSEKEALKNYFSEGDDLLFNQKPIDKLNYIEHLQTEKKLKVAMIGDGLNDAGALKQSEVGIAISDNINNFSPACDVVMAGENFYLINDFILFSKKQKTIIYSCFTLSILYNIVGLFFAVQGTLQPVIAAILMPISSISIVLLTLSMSNYYGLKIKRKIDKSHKHL